MILSEVEAEAMGRLLRCEVKEEGRKSEIQEQVVSWGSGTSGWSGQRPQATDSSDVSGQSIPMGALWVSSVQAGTLKKRRENFAALMKMVGESRTPRAQQNDGRSTNLLGLGTLGLHIHHTDSNICLWRA
jgi:hypothetical protein